MLLIKTEKIPCSLPSIFFVLFFCFSFRSTNKILVVSLSGLFLLVLNKLLRCVTLPIKFRQLIYEKLEIERGWFAEENTSGRPSVALSTLPAGYSCICVKAGYE